MAPRLLIATLFSAAALAACGGGDSSPAAAAMPAPGPVPAPVPAPAPATGSVSAPYVPTARAGAALFGVGSQGVVTLTGHVQAAAGAVTTINGASLGAPATVRDIQGDASFAMGRWTVGTATGVGAAALSTLTETSNAAVHYVLFNKPATLPTSGSRTCDAGVFTTPTYVGGTSVTAADFVGRAAGSAAITFSASGAAVALSLNIGNAASTGSASFNGTVAPSVDTFIAGNIGTGANNAYVTLGTSAGAYDVVGGYQVSLASGAQYTGVFRFRCA